MDVVPNSMDVVSLPPEELAVLLLQNLNYLAVHDPMHRRQENTAFSFSNYVTQRSSEYENTGQQSCAFAIAAAWQHLVTTGMLAPYPQHQAGQYFLTPRGRAVQSKSDYDHFRKVALYPRGFIHPVKESFAEFLRGDYETAVFKAFKAIEVAVRPHTTAPANVVGRDLMVKAFQPESGALTDKDEVSAERESLMELYRGAIGRFKNPTGHREVNFDNPIEVIEILELASLLMRILDRRVAALGART